LGAGRREFKSRRSDHFEILHFPKSWPFAHVLGEKPTDPFSENPSPLRILFTAGAPGVKLKAQ
jgi:hypothetical protein